MIVHGQPGRAVGSPDEDHANPQPPTQPSDRVRPTMLDTLVGHQDEGRKRVIRELASMGLEVGDTLALQQPGSAQQLHLGPGERGIEVVHHGEAENRPQPGEEFGIRGPGQQDLDDLWPSLGEERGRNSPSHVRSAGACQRQAPQPDDLQPDRLPGALSNCDPARLRVIEAREDEWNATVRCALALGGLLDGPALVGELHDPAGGGCDVGGLAEQTRCWRRRPAAAASTEPGGGYGGSNPGRNRTCDTRFRKRVPAGLRPAETLSDLGICLPKSPGRFRGFLAASRTRRGPECHARTRCSPQPLGLPSLIGFDWANPSVTKALADSARGRWRRELEHRPAEVDVPPSQGRAPRCV